MGVSRRNVARAVPQVLPPTADPDTVRVIAARAARGLADGFISVLLAVYLHDLGFTSFEIGLLITATLLGSAVLTMAVGLFATGMPPVRLLLGAACLMFATGLGFASLTAFWPLLVVAFAGTINPSGGDVSVFLPVEQGVLASKVGDNDRTALFARYNLAGTLAAAVGALSSAVPAVLARWQNWDVSSAERFGFVLYAAVAILIAALYLGVSVQLPPRSGRRVLHGSRRVVLELSALFSLDSFAGGFVVQSLLVLWLFERHAVSEAGVAATFFGMGLLAAFSQLASSALAARIGLVRTMVFTHIPASVLLILAALAPTAPLAIVFLLARTAFSQMDVPARQSFVMAVVPPGDRAAAASITNVPRSLASAIAPSMAGAMLAATSFGWPLICAGLGKIAYDLLLLARFGRTERPSRVTAL